MPGGAWQTTKRTKSGDNVTFVLDSLHETILTVCGFGSLERFLRWSVGLQAEGMAVRLSTVEARPMAGAETVGYRARGVDCRRYNETDRLELECSSTRGGRANRKQNDRQTNGVADDDPPEGTRSGGEIIL